MCRIKSDGKFSVLETWENVIYKNKALSKIDKIVLTSIFYFVTDVSHERAYYFLTENSSPSLQHRHSNWVKAKEVKLEGT